MTKSFPIAAVQQNDGRLWNLYLYTFGNLCKMYTVNNLDILNQWQISCLNQYCNRWKKNSHMMNLNCDKNKWFTYLCLIITKSNSLFYHTAHQKQTNTGWQIGKFTDFVRITSKSIRISIYCSLQKPPCHQWYLWCRPVAQQGSLWDKLLCIAGKILRPWSNTSNKATHSGALKTSTKWHTVI